MKQRQRRGESAPPEATVIVRAYRLEPAALARDVQRNFDAYGFFGLSVFAETRELSWELIAADKFPRADWITLFSAADIYDARARALGHGPGSALRRRAPGPRRAVAAYPWCTTPDAPESRAIEEARVKTPRIDIWADLNAEDDEGRNWSLMHEATRARADRARCGCDRRLRGLLVGRADRRGRRRRPGALRPGRPRRPRSTRPAQRRCQLTGLYSALHP